MLGFRSINRRQTSGFTLLELLTVLTIMAAVGGIVVTTLGSGLTVVDGAGRSVTGEAVATQATFIEIEKALMGSREQSGYHTHNLELPSRIAGLLIDVDGLGSFDFTSHLGWNGPYLFDTGARYGDATEPADADNFTSTYGNDSDPAILDAWGKPIVLQQSDTTDARLVSAGPNQILETDPSNAVDADRGDDLVRFLLTIDPNL
ncbi:MAG: prepilin-type N-terminal cleavage/methylation domain-containing protein [Verrucomicrobiota bacterium]